MSEVQAIARTYNDAGICTPRGTVSIVPIPGSPHSFQATLRDRGGETDLGVLVELPGKRRHYALLAQAFALLADR